MKGVFLDTYASSGSDTEALEDSSSDSDSEQEELDGDFIHIWRKLREVISDPQPPANQGLQTPKLSDMVMYSSDLVFRPNTVVVRMYPMGLFEDISPLPPISEKRRQSPNLPGLFF